MEKFDKFKNILMTVLVGGFFLVLSVICWVKPSSEISTTERRKLAQFPKLGTEQLLNGKFMSEFETYTLDQFPARDAFRSVKAFANLYVLRQKENNDFYVRGGSIGKQDYPMDTQSIDYAAKVFERLYQSVLADTDVNVYLSLIPDKNYFLAEDAGQLSYDYDAFVSYVKEKMPYMQYIDIFPCLEADDYYLTDPHWRQECLGDVADALLTGMNADGAGSMNPDYVEHTAEKPFYGAYYGQLGLPVRPDALTYLTSDTLEGCRVYDKQNDREISIYDLEKADSIDPYELYLYGSLSLVEIENPFAATDRELVIFRDSFGSSLAPLLVENYSKITLVDIRYLQSMFVGQFVEFDDQDVLFMYSTMVLNHSETLK